MLDQQANLTNLGQIADGLHQMQEKD